MLLGEQKSTGSFKSPCFAICASSLALEDRTGFVEKSVLSWRYFKVSACALPKLAFEACAPAQNGTAMSAKSF